MRYLILVLVALAIMAIPAMADNNNSDSVNVTVKIDSFYNLSFAGDPAFSYEFDTTTKLDAVSVNFGSLELDYVTNDPAHDTITAAFNPGTGWPGEWYWYVGGVPVTSYSVGPLSGSSATYPTFVMYDDDHFWDEAPNTYTGTFVFTLGA